MIKNAYKKPIFLFFDERKIISVIPSSDDKLVGISFARS